jgi:hypothetical protein
MDRMKDVETGELEALAEDYFSLLARSLPACCLSDEFYTLPRAEEARFHLSRTEHLEREPLEEICRKVEGMRMALNPFLDVTEGTSAGLLAQSMDSFLLHWGVLRIWERDPALYLKTAWIGLDLALRLPGIGGEERAQLYRARLHVIPALLARGERQITEVTDPAREVSLEMAETCRALLEEIRSGLLPAEFMVGEEDRGLLEALQQEAGNALGALDRFQRFLKETNVAERPVLGRELFEEVLRQGVGWTGGFRESQEILEDEASAAESELEALAARIAPGDGWQAVYRGVRLPPRAYRDPVSLYREEVGRLETFFRGRDTLPMPPRDSVHVEPTPSYLEPVRATASYAAPTVPEAASQGGRFFVLNLDPGSAGEDRAAFLEAEHRDYRYLTAHETVPGHHLLDCVRLRQKDPVRRQVESVLYYEGWACYAEQLLDEYGYDPQPVQRLIRLRRNLWRAVRGGVDAGLQTGEMLVDQAAARLEAIGSGSVQARRQARRITLTPGYQLCYTLGKHGFLDLRNRFVPPLTLKRFHQIVLSSGQAPFPLLARECVE